MSLRHLAAAAILLSTMPAAANPIAEATTARQEAFKGFGRAMKAISDELRGGSPAAAVVRTNAQQIAAAAPRIPTWFPAGSGPESGLKTEALAAIWQKPQEFSKAAADLASASRALDAAAASGDVAAMRAAAGNVGGACKACHDNFRLKK